MTLTDFLLARIAEDEAAARAARGPSRTPMGDDAADEVLWMARNEGVAEAGVLHFARHDPARVLAECEAKRRIVEQLQRHERLVQANAEKHAEASSGGLANQEQVTALRTHGWELGGRLEALRMAADALAVVYADHPDYQQEWKP